jgi:hypothetical protein
MFDDGGGVLGQNKVALDAALIALAPPAKVE